MLGEVDTKMDGKIRNFLVEMLEEQFPQQFGPWIAFDVFDPKWTRKELREMKRNGLIQLDEKNKRFRLTMKATLVNELWRKENK